MKPHILNRLDAHRFKAPWWLRNAHLQTIWGPVFRRQRPLPLRLERWETPDDDFLRLHFLDNNPEAPTVLMLHGLGGCVRSNYITGLTRLFLNMGWNAAILEFRSCGGEMNRARRLYHAGETSDLAFVVEALSARIAPAALYLMGVSLGGNVAAKWLGEQGDEVPANVRGAAIVSPPFDPMVSGPNLDKALGGLYAKWFLRSLIPAALEKERQYPGCIDREKVRHARSLYEFDLHATCPLHGFRDVEHYWGTVGCVQNLDQIRRPTLLIAAADDPFNPGSTIPHAAAAESPWLYPQFTRHGGHAGFVHGPHPFRTRYWAEEQVARFLATLYEEEYARLPNP